jgi:hypothetical protein
LGTRASEERQENHRSKFHRHDVNRFAIPAETLLIGVGIPDCSEIGIACNSVWVDSLNGIEPMFAPGPILDQNRESKPPDNGLRVQAFRSSGSPRNSV